MNYCVNPSISMYYKLYKLKYRSTCNKKKVIFKHTLHKTHVNKYRMLILLSEYQNSNEYPNEWNIFAALIHNYKSQSVASSHSLHTVQMVVNIQHCQDRARPNHINNGPPKYISNKTQ